MRLDRWPKGTARIRTPTRASQADWAREIKSLQGRTPGCGATQYEERTCLPKSHSKLLGLRKFGSARMLAQRDVHLVRWRPWVTFAYIQNLDTCSVGCLMSALYFAAVLSETLIFPRHGASGLCKRMGSIRNVEQ